MTRLSLRSHYWGALMIVVAAGEIDAGTGERLAPYLRKLQTGNDLVLDLWDVTTCDAAGVALLEDAKRHADEAGWGFAIVVDPAGPCAGVLREAESTIPTFDDRQGARAALQGSRS
jgi:anti-anti-sigma regulatory factor